ALRQHPGTTLPANFLKHADEQTVAGVAAVFQAIGAGSLSDVSFTHWGVLAAPRFLARTLLAVTVQRFAVEAAWGISPPLIPPRGRCVPRGRSDWCRAVPGCLACAGESSRRCAKAAVPPTMSRRLT